MKPDPFVAINASLNDCNRLAAKIVADANEIERHQKVMGNALKVMAGAAAVLFICIVALVIAIVIEVAK